MLLENAMDATAYRSRLQTEMSGQSFQRQSKEKIKFSEAEKRPLQMTRLTGQEVQLHWKQTCPTNCFIIISKATECPDKHSRNFIDKKKVFQLCKSRKKFILGLIALYEACSQFICLCAVTEDNTKLFCFAFFFLIKAVVAPKDL